MWYFTQEIILQLETRTAIEKIQILGSGFMVPSSIELFLGDDTSEDGPDVNEAYFLKIGDVDFQNPTRSRLVGRQLQTIELQGNNLLKASFLKIVLKHNHLNKRNEYNQVGLMGVCFYGTPQKAKVGTNLSRRGSRLDEFSVIPRRQDLAFLMYTDKDIVEVDQFENQGF